MKYVVMSIKYGKKTAEFSFTPDNGKITADAIKLGVPLLLQKVGLDK